MSTDRDPQDSRPFPARDIPVRRLQPLPTDRVGSRFAAGDPVLSHVLAVLSGMFPSGESFFVRSVRDQRERVADPELREQVNRFVGQESMHGRLHRQLNSRLEELGFKVGLVDRVVDIGFNRIIASLLPPKVQLAVTAALEHYTATLAEVLMSDPQAQALFDDESVCNLFLWHALEESEHKAVAFDVYRAVGGSDVLRRVTMDVTTVVFLGGLALGSAYSTVSNSSTRDLASVFAGFIRLARSPFLSAGVVRRVRAYNRRDFHPDVFDATELCEQWREQLFGANGILSDRLRA
jgi:predicted metal-dependent hydrolase